MENIIANIAAGWGVDYKDTILTQAEVQAEQQRLAALEQQPQGQQQPQ